MEEEQAAERGSACSTEFVFHVFKISLVDVSGGYRSHDGAVCAVQADIDVDSRPSVGRECRLNQNQMCSTRSSVR